MRNSDLFVLAAKLVTLTGFDYKNHPELSTHERDAIDNGLRELRFYDPNFHDKYTPVEARAVGKPGRPTKGV